MKKLYLIISVFMLLLLQGCATNKPKVEVSSKTQSCKQKCKRKGLLKRGYQKIQSIERCQMRC
jgi:PBP1b-binding outer membrane lipoprotein LpoB